MLAQTQVCRFAQLNETFTLGIVRNDSEPITEGLKQNGVDLTSAGGHFKTVVPLHG
jgi:hypothetical protein